MTNIWNQLGNVVQIGNVLRSQKVILCQSQLVLLLIAIFCVTVDNLRRLWQIAFSI